MGYIYQISNTINDKVYIGSTTNINRRWKSHRNALLRNKHCNIHLQRFVNKYSIDTIIFSIIEEVDNDDLLKREQFYIDITPNKFNLALSSNAPMKNKHHTQETKNKISKHSKGCGNPIYGTKRPQYIIDALKKSSLNRIKNKNEKIKRVINLSNRKEVIIEKDDVHIYCFSVAHAANIIGVSQQSVSRAFNKSTKAFGWSIKISNDMFYDKDILFNNIDLFDDNCYPNSSLIEMLNDLRIKKNDY